MSNPVVIYEDKNFLVVNKPTGLLVHKAISNLKSQISKVEETTLVDWLIKKYPEIKGVGDDPATRPGIVHRLDRDTSGVMLVARNQLCFEHLKKLFQAHGVKKTYLAVVQGKLDPPRGVIDAPIGLKIGTVRRSTRSKHMKMVKSAVTEYKLLLYLKSQKSNIKSGEEKIKNGKKKEEDILSLVEVTPKTGRTHQIRVHLASIGHPIVGDALYGKKAKKNSVTLYPLPVTRLMLHSLSIEFATEDGKRLKISAEPPGEFDDIIKAFVLPRQ